MPPDNPASLVKDGKLTPIPDKTGIEIIVCVPPLCDERKTYRITNAPVRTASLEFDGADLNYAARVLYAEASGSLQLADPATRAKEKEAIMNVNHFRLNRRGYPNNAYVAKTFKQVCDAPGQFESVFAGKPKFLATAKPVAEKLRKAECIDLSEALDAVRLFLSAGPNSAYQFDNFRGYDPNGQGTHIGRSRFWLSSNGAEFLVKTP